MKKLFIFSIIAVGILFSSCTKEDNTTLQPFNKIIFEEDFNKAVDGTVFDLPGWTNFAQIGTRQFTEQIFSGNGYAEFSSFGSTQLVNIGWLVSPQIDMDKQTGEILTFKSAQSFLRSRDNVLEVLVSTNFDGTNVAAANWVVVPAIIPTPETKRFEYVFSGQIDLSGYSGKLNFAFRVKGSGTITTMTGTYQIDDVMVFHQVNEQF